jgi:S1-C subfamily serine protease
LRTIKAQNSMKRFSFDRMACLATVVICVTGTSWGQSAASNSKSADILAHASESAVLILTGEGAGRLQGVATGTIVRTDGVILTAYHVVKEAHEVQVRLKNGEIYDQTELLGADERRDVAALKITGHDLPALAISTDAKVVMGEPAYAVTSSSGLGWSATEGIFSGMRTADEVNGAGSGYRLIQFTAPVAPGASGGPLVNGRGELVGIITRGMSQGASFAVPIENVIGLAEGTMHKALGNGQLLQIPKTDATPSSAAVSAANPQSILRSAKTAAVRSRTMFFTADSLERALSREKEFPALGLLLVKDARVADLILEIDRPLFTYQFTYSLLDPKTSIVLASGKVTAFDGEAASNMIAEQVLKILEKSRTTVQAGS